MSDPAAIEGARIAVLVSGHSRGSNLQAIMDACRAGELKAKVCIVIATRRDVPALARAAQAGCATAVVSPKKYEDDVHAYGEALLAVLKDAGAEIICLAGYMRRLPPVVLAAFPQRVLNVHPALLPLFGGKGMFGEHVHRAVLESGMKVSGCTVHLVDEEYDHGPILLQEAVPVHDDDTWETLAARVLPVEHATYVRAIKLVAEGRVRVAGNRTFILPEATQSRDARRNSVCGDGDFDPGGRSAGTR